MKLKAFLSNFLISCIVVFLGIFVYDRFFEKEVHLVEKNAEAQIDQVSLNNAYLNRLSKIYGNSNSTDFSLAANRATSSVVYINAYEKIGNSLFKNEVKREKGSGVIVSDDGDIITNYHVVADADYIEITLGDKREFKAEIIGIDEVSDIALLHIEASDLPHLLFANSDSLDIGDWVLAVGNPFGLQSTVTAGIVSAKARDLDILDKNDIGSYIQTDAVLNPGSSGGALVNSRGQLMGICSAILSSSGNYQGLSFAIPSNVARKVIVDIKEFGSVQRGKIGIGIEDVNAAIAKSAKLEKVSGVRINSVNLNSAAQASGLKKGDIITIISGVSINDTPEFYEVINKYRPGDEIEVSYYRKGYLKRSKLMLRNHLNTTDYISVRTDKILRDLGIEIRDLNSLEKNRLNAEGIMVISVSKGSTISNTNMEPGFIVEKFNDIEIRNSQEFIALLKNTKDSVILNGFYERYPGQYPYSFMLSSDFN